MTQRPDRPPLALPEVTSTSSPPATFSDLCRSFGIDLKAQELQGLGRFLGLLLAHNTRVNLTAIRDEEEGWTRHVFDALTLLSVLHDLPEGARVADLGSGGGLPALPLATVLPHLRFTLIEATGKKADFLTAASARLALRNVDVVADRAETVGRDPDHRERYDVVIARAVGALRILVELGVPLAKVGGRCVFVKGARADDELEDARKALHQLHARHEGTLDTPTGRLVVLAKRQPSPRKYPRRPGEPKRAPI